MIDAVLNAIRDQMLGDPALVASCVWFVVVLAGCIALKVWVIRRNRARKMGNRI